MALRASVCVWKAKTGSRTSSRRNFPLVPAAAFGTSVLWLVLRWGVAFLVSGGICFLLTRYLTTPILRLREASRQLAAGNLSTRAVAGTQNRHDELGELVRDFNSMGDRIEGLITSQRQLISDVSHELRSPLARLTVALDLAREHKGNDPVFDQMEKDFERLSDMTARLLTVARLDASPAPAEMRRVNFGALVAEVVADCGVRVARPQLRGTLFERLRDPGARQRRPAAQRDRKYRPQRYPLHPAGYGSRCTSASPEFFESGLCRADRAGSRSWSS